MATDARFDTPCGVSVDGGGNIHVADTGNGAVRRIDPSGVVTTLAREVDGALMRPIAVVSGDDGALYVSDERGAHRRDRRQSAGRERWPGPASDSATAAVATRISAGWRHWPGRDAGG